MGQIESSAVPALKSESVAYFFGTFTVAGLNMATLSAARLVIPLIALSMGAGASMVGTIAALFTAFPMLLSVSFGRWLDRVGTLIPMVFAGGLSVCAAVMFWVAPYPYTLLAVAGCIGAGCVFSHMAATRAVGAAGGHSSRARNLGYLVLSYSLFQFMGPMIAGAAYHYWGAHVAITTLGAFSLLSITVLALRWHHFKFEKAGVKPEVINQKAYQLLSIGPLRSWIFISSIFVAAQCIFPFVVSLYAMEIGLTAVRASWLLGAFAAGVFVSRFCTPWVTRRFTAKHILKSALVLSAITYVVIPLTHDIYALIALSCLLGMPLGIGVPIALVMIYDAAPPGRVNESVGLSMSVNNLLQTVLPLTLGIAISRFGIAPMAWVIALGMIATAVFARAGGARKRGA